MTQEQKKVWRGIKHLYDPARDSPSVAQSACELKRTNPDAPASWCWDRARDYHVAPRCEPKDNVEIGGW